MRDLKSFVSSIEIPRDMGEGIDSQAYQHLDKKTTLEIEKLRTEFILFK